MVAIIYEENTSKNDEQKQLKTATVIWRRCTERGEMDSVTGHHCASMVHKYNIEITVL